MLVFLWCVCVSNDRMRETAKSGVRTGEQERWWKLGDWETAWVRDKGEMKMERRREIKRSDRRNHCYLSVNEVDLDQEFAYIIHNLYLNAFMFKCYMHCVLRYDNVFNNLFCTIVSKYRIHHGAIGPLMSHLATQLGYSAGEFQALQLIVLATFGVVD